ncbi:MAG TPA: hypothetical protein VGJ59_17875 [Jatrophihabitantaceae bacterium]
MGWLLVLLANWRTVWNIIRSVTSAAWAFIRPIFNAIKTLGISPVQIAIDILDGHWTAALRHFAGVTSGTVRFLGPIFYGIRFVIDMMRAAIDLLTGHWSAAWQIMGGAVRAAVAPILATINAIVSGVHAAAGAIQSALGGIGSAVNAVSIGGSFNYSGCCRACGTRSPRTVATPQAGISAKAGTGSTERGSERLFKTGSQVRVMPHGTGPAPASGGGTTIINRFVIAGSVWAARDLAREMQAEMLRQGIRWGATRAYPSYRNEGAPSRRLGTISGAATLGLTRRRTSRRRPADSRPVAAALRR